MIYQLRAACAVALLLLIGQSAELLGGQARVVPFGEEPPPPPTEDQPAPPAPPAYDFTVRGGERLGWDQDAADADELAGLTFRLAVDDVASPLTDVECDPADRPGGFECEAPLPPLAPGVHVLWVSAAYGDDELLGGARSVPITVLVEASTSAGDPARSQKFDAQLGASWLAGGLADPADLAVLPDGRVLVAERAGRIRVFRDGVLAPTSPLVLDDLVTGDGRGLLTLAVDRDFQRTRHLFAGYSIDGGLRVVRLQLVGETLTGRATILDALPVAASQPRAVLRMGPDRTLYLALDDRGSAERAADLGDYSGKLLRFNQDGTVPRDQPAGSPVYMAGVRQPSGLVWTTQPASLWVADQSSKGRARLHQAAVLPSETRQAVVLDFIDGAVGASGRPAVASARDGGLLLTTGPGPDGLRHLTLEGGRMVTAPVSLPALDSLGALRAMAVGVDGDVYVCTAHALLRLEIPERRPFMR